MNYSLSETAVERLQKLKKEGKTPLRIQVDSGGCAGFQYIFSMNSQTTEDDLVLEENGTTILIDALSFSFLEGSLLDYTEEMIGSSFVVKNPNAGRSCGCKSSFSLINKKNDLS